MNLKKFFKHHIRYFKVMFGVTLISIILSLNALPNETFIGIGVGLGNGIQLTIFGFPIYLLIRKLFEKIWVNRVRIEED